MESFDRYYESEESRARRRAKHPEEKLPPREQPPFTRDWRLPKGPFLRARDSAAGIARRRFNSQAIPLFGALHI